MENSVKDYIVSRLSDLRCLDFKVQQKKCKNGFIVGFVSVISSDIFDVLYFNRAYLKKHHVAWYVTQHYFDEYGCDLRPSIVFFDDVEDVD